MSKISGLPEKPNPTGGETVVVLDDGVTKRAPIATLVSAAVGPSLALLDGALLTLNDQLSLAEFTIVESGGAVARGDRGLTFVGGAGSGFGAEIQAFIPRDAAMNDGELWTFPFNASTSAIFTRGITGKFYAVTQGGAPLREVVSRVIRTPGRIGLEIDYTVQEGDIGFIPVFGTAYEVGSPDEEWVELERLEPRLANNNATLQAILTSKLQQYAERFGVGDVLEDASLLRDLANGAVEDGRFGVVFPDDTHGQNTTALVSYTIDADAHLGRKMLLIAAFRKSAGFTRSLNPGFMVATVVYPGGKAPGALSLEHPGDRDPDDPGRPFNIETLFENDQLAIYAFEYTIVAGDLKLLPFVQQTSATNTTADERLELVALRLGYMSAVWPGLTPADEALADAIGRRAGGEAPRFFFRRVSADDLGGPYQAMQSITRTTAGFWHCIDLGRATYDLPGEIFTKNFVAMQGAGPDATILRLALPNDSSAELIAATSAIYADSTGRYGGFSLEVWNCRYGIHCDTGATLMNRIIEFQHIRALHHGNDDAPANNWGGQNAMGCGVSGGGELRVFDFYLWSKNGNAFSAHNNVNATLPAKIHLKRGVLAPGENGQDVMVVLAIGSRQADQCIIEDTVIGGPWQFSTQGWYHSDLLNNPANHWEWDISGSGNTPAVFRNQDQGLALRIDSATKGPGSSVEIGGDMKPLLFGDGVVGRSFKRRGSPGFSAAEWGYGDVSGFPELEAGEIVLKKPYLVLGKRAGNRTASLRMLTVAIDGNAPVNIVFNGDYTHATQEFMLDMIQDAIGAAGVVSLYNPGARERPRFFDEEFAPLITATMPTAVPGDDPLPTGIEMGLGCAFDGDRNKVRLMTSEDPTHLFAGIAWQDCAHGLPGRVKSRGFLPITDVRRIDPEMPFAFGDTFSIHPDHPGMFVKGGTQGLLRAISSDAVEVA